MLQETRKDTVRIEGSIQEEDKTIIDIYAPNIGAPEYIMQILTTIKVKSTVTKNSG